MHNCEIANCYKSVKKYLDYLYEKIIIKRKINILFKIISILLKLIKILI